MLIKLITNTWDAELVVDGITEMVSISWSDFKKVLIFLTAIIIPAKNIIRNSNVILYNLFIFKEVYNIIDETVL